MGLNSRLSRGSLSGGDRSLAAMLTQIAKGVFAPISFGWPHRWPPTPAVPAIGCFARPLLLKVGLSSKSLFQFRRSRECPTTMNTIIQCAWYSEAIFVRVLLVIHWNAQVLCVSWARRCITRWRSWRGEFFPDSNWNPAAALWQHVQPLFGKLRRQMSPPHPQS